jgi:hypothetical protein
METGTIAQRRNRKGFGASNGEWGWKGKDFELSTIAQRSDESYFNASNRERDIKGRRMETGTIDLERDLKGLMLANEK